MSYDEKCYDLGASFLRDEPAIDNEVNRVELAQAIQEQIEDYIAFAKART